MSITATTTYLAQSSSSFSSTSTSSVTASFGAATLLDADLTRGDDTGEAVTLGIGEAPGGGPRRFFTEGT